MSIPGMHQVVYRTRILSKIYKVAIRIIIIIIFLKYVVLSCVYYFGKMLNLKNVMQVNMSIAILPMSAEFNWSPTTVGLVQSSFFWGYLLTQVFYSPMTISHLSMEGIPWVVSTCCWSL